MSTDKFINIYKDSTLQLKYKLSKIVTTINCLKDVIHLSKLVGSYSPGYIYDNVKIHKRIEDTLLRPIISPTYSIARQLNNILKPDTSQKYSVESSHELLHDIRKITEQQGILAFSDAESLFTNVPIGATIAIILRNVYQMQLYPS